MMAIYLMLLMLIRDRFMGNEITSTKSYVIIAIMILAFGFIAITYLNIKMIAME